MVETAREGFEGIVGTKRGSQENRERLGGLKARPVVCKKQG
jgi:hypothetical protein